MKGEYESAKPLLVTSLQFVYIRLKSLKTGDDSGHRPASLPAAGLPFLFPLAWSPRTWFFNDAEAFTAFD